MTMDGVDKLEATLDQGYTLPAEWYTSAEYFQKEQAHIFRHAWHYVARRDQLARHGDYITCRAGNVPIVVVCDEAGELRAYANVCGHRGSEIVLCSGNRKTLQCHYHGWTWGLDGKLLAAPRSKEQATPFNKDDFPLISVQVASFGPFVFVNPDPHAPPLLEMLGELPRLIADTGADINALRFREQRVYDLECNWKVVVENFLECYHCSIAHQGFSDLIDLNRYRVTPYDYYSVQRGPLKASAEEQGFYGMNTGSQEGIYTFFWPNFMLNSYPGPGNASLNLILPVSENRTRAIYEFYYVDGFPEEEADKLTDFIDHVQREDIVICEAVQRGLASGFYHQGRLMLSHENGIQHFQKLVYRALAAGGAA
jgi:choline monooxygenase